RARGRQHGWPLSFAAARQVRQRMLVGRCDFAHESAILHPGSVEHVDIAELISKNHAFAVAIEAAIDEWLGGLRCRGNIEHLAIGGDAVHEAEATVREANEASCPNRFHLERVGIEARRHLALLAEANANRTRNGALAGTKDATLERAQVGLIPPAILPDSIALIAPMPVLAAVQARPFRQEKGPGALFL